MSGCRSYHHLSCVTAEPLLVSRGSLDGPCQGVFFDDSCGKYFMILNNKGNKSRIIFLFLCRHSGPPKNTPSTPKSPQGHQLRGKQTRLIG